MEVKNIMSIMVVALVGAVILVGFVPVIGATQENIGDPITFNNGGNNPITYDYYNEDFTMVIDSVTGTASIGDYSISKASDTPRIIMWEYGRVNLNTPSQTTMGGFNDYRTGTTVGILGDATISYDHANKTITLSQGGTDTVCIANTVMAIKEGGAYVYVPSSGIANSYYRIENVDNNTLGFLDTVVTYDGNSLEVVYNKSGITVYGLPEGTEYTAKLDIVDKVKVDGTTDVYRGGTPTFTITIGEDEIVEHTFRFGQSVIKEVTGHKDSGALYDVYGLIPLIVAVGLLMFAITAILIRRV